MKKIIQYSAMIMIVAGLLLFLGTAEASDIDEISISTVVSQNLLAVSMVILGAGGHKLIRKSTKRTSRWEVRKREPARIFGRSEGIEQYRLTRKNILNTQGNKKILRAI